MYTVQFVIGLVVISMVLMIGINILGNFDGNIDCTSINSTAGQDSCTNAKDNIWLAQDIAPYGIILAVIAGFVGVGRVMGFI